MSKKFLLIMIIFNIYKIAYSVPIELKNIVIIEGMIDYPVIGYGIVTGLKGTGDSEKNTITKDMIEQIVNNFGINSTNKNIKIKNSAIVMVTAVINTLLSPGNRIDVKVSSVYDAKSLEGGELIVTPLIGENNEVFVVAQGSIISDKNNKGVTGVIPGGGIVQKSAPLKVTNIDKILNLVLVDYYTLDNVYVITESIKKEFPNSIKGIFQNKITLSVPDNMEYIEFINKIFNIKVELLQNPRIIIDSRSGTIVAGGNIVVTEAAISFQNIKLQVGSSYASISNRLLRNLPQSQINLESIKYLPETVTLQDLVNGLNKIGASTQDIIRIIQMLHKNGNIKANLEIQ